MVSWQAVSWLGSGKEAGRKFDYTNDISAFELLESRVILESEAAALAARMITDDELILLEKALQKLKLEINQASTADREFHTVIAKGTHNKVLEKQINHLWNLQDNLNHINLTKVNSSVIGIEKAIKPIFGVSPTSRFLILVGWI